MKSRLTASSSAIVKNGLESLVYVSERPGTSGHTFFSAFIFPVMVSIPPLPQNWIRIFKEPTNLPPDTRLAFRCRGLNQQHSGAALTLPEQAPFFSYSFSDTFSGGNQTHLRETMLLHRPGAEPALCFRSSRFQFQVDRLRGAAFV